MPVAAVGNIVLELDSGLFTMLTPVEQMIFIFLALFAVGATYAGFKEMADIINRGTSELYLDRLPARLWTALRVYITQQPTLKTRRLTSLIHLGVVWGFTFYFLVNLGDVISGYFSIIFLGEGWIGNFYRFLADLLTAAVLIGMLYFLVRRFIVRPKALAYHDNVLLVDAVRAGGGERHARHLYPCLLYTSPSPRD